MVVLDADGYLSYIYTHRDYKSSNSVLLGSNFNPIPLTQRDLVPGLVDSSEIREPRGLTSRSS